MDLGAVRYRDSFWRIFCLLKMEENCIRDCIIYQGCIVCLSALLHCSDILYCIMQMSLGNFQDAFSCLLLYSSAMFAFMPVLIICQKD